MKKYIIDGNNFDSLDTFYEQVSKVLIPGSNWGHNLDAFNDILSGGFGTPDEGFILIWKNCRKSLNDLGYLATIKWLEEGIGRIHPTNIEIWKARIELAKNNQGNTLFHQIIDIILNHSNIELVLN